MAEAKRDLSEQLVNPPLVETAISVQFAQLANFTVGHFGWFWKEYLGKEWVKCTGTQHLPEQFEKFDEQQWVQAKLRLALAGPRPERVQIENEGSDRMIQVQNTRFVYNWRKGENAYPSFQKTKHEFSAAFATFVKFVAEAGLGDLDLNQWEITYVNHIPKSHLWTTPAEWHKVIPGLMHAGTKIPGVSYAGLSGEWTYVIPPQRGRLHVAAQHARAGSATGPEVLSLQFTTRGPVLAQDGWRLDDGLAVGHEAVVSAFLHLTSDEARAGWARTVTP